MNKYFYSYHLRNRESGATVGYGQGVANLEIPVHDAPQLDHLKFLVIEELHKEDESLDVDSVDVHLLACTPL